MQEKDEKANEIIYRNGHQHAALKPKFVKIPTTRQRGWVGQTTRRMKRKEKKMTMQRNTDNQIFRKLTKQTKTERN